MLSIYFALKLPLSFAFLSACWDCYQQHTEGWLLSQRLSWHPQPRPTQWQSACDSSWDVIAHTADTRENLWNEIPGFSIPLLRLSTAEQLRAQRVREQKAARRGCLLLLSSNTNPECHLFLSYSQWPEMQWGGYQHEFCTAVLTTACTQLVCTASNSLLKKKNTLGHNNSHCRRTKLNGRSTAHQPQDLADLKSPFYIFEPLCFKC